MEQKKGVLFDMDGTLVNTFDNINFKQAFSELKTVQKKLILKILASRVKSFAQLEAKVKEEIEDPQQAQELLQKFHEFLLEHYDNTDLKEGALQFLTYLKDHDYKICLCTNNASDIVQYILERKQLKDYFDYVITSQEVVKAKPDPSMYQMALHEIALTREECIVFEDTESGILAAKQAGLDVIVVSEKEKKKFQDCNMIIKDYHDDRLYQLF